MTKTNLGNINTVIVYDGGFLRAVRKYYKYGHAPRQWLNIQALQDHLVTALEEEFKQPVRLVAAHLYAGRFSFEQVNGDGRDLYEFESALVSAGVETHYRRIRQTPNGMIEKGIDVALSLGVYDLALSGNIDVIILVAGDGDLVPLLDHLAVRRIYTMIAGFEFENAGFSTGVADEMKTRAGWYYDVGREIEKRGNTSVIRNLFRDVTAHPTPLDDPTKIRSAGRIQNILHTDGYGFIRTEDGANRFFHVSNIAGCRFDDLHVGCSVSFEPDENERGLIAKNVMINREQGANL